MTKHYVKDNPAFGGICTKCEHDLEGRDDGNVYCTNRACRHHSEPHPTTAQVNMGKRQVA